jgi:hypothetical protein
MKKKKLGPVRLCIDFDDPDDVLVFIRTQLGEGVGIRALDDADTARVEPRLTFIAQRFDEGTVEAQR